MTQRDYRPVKPLTLGLLVAGGVIIIAGLLLMFAGMQYDSVPVLITLISGVAVVVFGIILDLRGIRLVFANRQTGMGFISAVTVLLALIILILVNFVASRHSVKFDWTEKKQWTLSDRVKTLMAGLDRQITATVVFYPRGDVDYENSEISKRLLEQLADSSPNFTFEYVDLSRSPDSWKAVRDKFGIGQQDVPCVVFVAGDRKEIVTFDSLFNIEPSMEEGGERKAGYKGETRFASTIMTLQGRIMPRIYFTTGHGEYTLEKDMKDVVEELRANYLDAKPCPDLTRNPLPEDCAALFVVGATRPFAADEVRRIGDYLTQRKGSLYVGVEPTAATGLDGLLASYGIVLDDDVVIDMSSGRKSFSVDAKPLYGEITRDLQNERIHFEGVRSIQILPMPPGPSGRSESQADPILITSNSVYGETNLEQVKNEGASSYEEGQDIRRQGGLVLAATYEKSQDSAQTIPEEGRRARLTIVGSGSYMLTTDYFGVPITPSYGNVQFFLRTVKWLAQTKDPIQIKPRDLDRRMMDKLANDKPASEALFWILVVGMPVVLVITGGIVWLFRRA